MKKWSLLLIIFYSYAIKSQNNIALLDTAINRSVINFQAKNGNLSPIYLDIFLYHLEKKYALNFNLDLKGIKTQFNKINIYEDSGPLYARLIGMPSNLINTKMIDSLHQPYDSIMLRALYADKLITKNAKFKKLLNIRLLDPDSYSISHSLFALAWLHELYPKKKYIVKYIKVFSIKGISILNSNTCGDLDRYCELAAILHYHHKGSEFYENWTKKILNLQNIDGSWGTDLNKPSFELEHCSIFALWFLLQQNDSSNTITYDWIKLTKN